MRERTAVLAIDLARHAKLLFDERELLGVILVLLIPRRHDASQRRQMATAALEFGSPDLLEHLPAPLLCGLGVPAVQCADRKSVLWGKGVSVGLEFCGRRIIKKKKPH